MLRGELNQFINSLPSLVSAINHYEQVLNPSTYRELELKTVIKVSGTNLNRS
jgi:hypothetical protein